MVDAVNKHQGISYRHVGEVGKAETVDFAAANTFVEACPVAVGTDAHREHGVEHRGMKQSLFRVDDAAVHAGDKSLIFGTLRPVFGWVFKFDLW